MMWNTSFFGTFADHPPREAQQIDLAEAAIRACLPASWSVARLTADEINANGLPRPDAMLLIKAPSGAASRILLETKYRLDPRDVLALAARFQQWRDRSTPRLGYDRTMVAAPFISPRTQSELRAANIDWIDATGNLHLQLELPAVFIARTGASRDPWGSKRDEPLHSLKGPAAARVMRALIDFRPPYGIRQLAKLAETPAASTSRVISLLARENLVQSEKTGGIQFTVWPNLLRRWVEDYGIRQSHRMSTFLDPRGHEALLGRLAREPLTYAVTGSLAAMRWVELAPPRLATIYVTDISEAAERLRLRPADRGANALLIEPFDPVMFCRSQTVADVVYAAPSQVAADLMTGTGREPAEGEGLITWLEAHEDEWRT